MVKVVLGGGLSGLSAAYYLLQKSATQNVKLIESSTRLGGWIKSHKVDGNVIFEQGPRTIRPTGEQGINTLGLLEDLGLGDKIIPISKASPAARNRMIYAQGNLVSLPSSLPQLFVQTPPFTKPLITQLLNDIRAPSKPLNDDTIYNFIDRRFGQEFADYLISPLICGICAGDAKQISVNFLMKQLFEYEQQYGSITRGLLRSLLKTKTKPQENKLSLRAKQEHWAIYSLKDGLETLPKTLENFLRSNQQVDIKQDVKCTNISIENNLAQLHLENGSVIETDHLISSVPSYKLAPLLKTQHPQFTELLNNIKYVNVGVVNLLYDQQLIDKPGFGFLVPPKENLPILGVIYDSCCFPYGPDKTVLTVMMGGQWFEKYFGGASEDKLLKTATQQLKTIMNITSKPTNCKVNILENCIPQYYVGHNENIQKIQGYIRDNKLPLSICGASYFGVGVNDVILSAKKAVESI